MISYLLQAPPKSTTPLYVVGIYLVLLLAFSIINSRRARGSAGEYFVASRSIGPFLLLMSVFGTTMTAFALVGSTGKAYDNGIGVYGLMASASGIVHSLVFFLVGIKLWAIGKRYNYVTQIQFFRNRFDSNALGYLLFPVLVGLVIPYLLIGILGAGSVLKGVAGVPTWLTGAVVCLVVLAYILTGGVRAAALANAVQTMVFMAVGLLAFFLISGSLGGSEAASQAVLENTPPRTTRGAKALIGHLALPQRTCFIPLSVGMFPHLFQHWLTARKSAKTFRTDRGGPSDLHHDRLGAVRADRRLGGRSRHRGARRQLERDPGQDGRHAAEEPVGLRAAGRRHPGRDHVVLGLAVRLPRFDVHP